MGFTGDPVPPAIGRGATANRHVDRAAWVQASTRRTARTLSTIRTSVDDHRIASPQPGPGQFFGGFQVGSGDTLAGRQPRSTARGVHVEEHAPRYHAAGLGERIGRSKAEARNNVVASFAAVSLTLPELVAPVMIAGLLGCQPATATAATFTDVQASTRRASTSGRPRRTRWSSCPRSRPGGEPRWAGARARPRSCWPPA